MKLWILSDLHADHGVGYMAVAAPDFDVFVCAGDVMTGDVAGSIERVAAIARGRPAVFVMGNHEWMTSADMEEVLDEAHATARREGVHFLECDAVEIGGVGFAGATLWTPDDVRFAPSVVALARLKADVVVTHFPPSFPMRTPPAGAKLWIFGHHHGFEDARSDRYRIVRNAVGYGNEVVDGEPARPDFTVEFEL